VALARRGLPIDWLTTLKIAGSAAILRGYTESSKVYLPDGMPPVGPYQGNPYFRPLGNLAASLARIQEAGSDDFYRGDLAALLAADLHDAGALLDAEDLANYAPSIGPSQQLDWAGHTLQLAGGLTASPTLVRVLGTLGAPSGAGLPDAEWYCRMAAAMKQAYAERLSGLGAIAPSKEETCTTHISVCDEDGSMVSLTTTLLSSMGSRYVLPRSGVLMNNGVMWFDPRPGQPNSMAPGKRPLTNMLPMIVRHAGRPVIAAGASGGRRIMAAVWQLVAFVLEFGMTPEQAAHQPRIDVSGPDSVSADARLPPEILDALRQEGELEIMEQTAVPNNFACPNLIAEIGPGQHCGISDTGSPGSAAFARP
jgi:gamma-glutamyltranspeptidase/glutathione hydrolase